ncbi:MAG TPA: hypothetical protein VIV11_42875 [Kofleriaceae bacterium]
MFERLQERQESNRKYWYRVGAGASIAITLGVLLLRWYLDDQEERRTRRYSSAYADVTPVQSKPERVKLPGMSIEVPSAGFETGNYQTGKYSGRSGITYELSWALGKPDPNLEQTFRASTATMQQKLSLQNPPEISPRLQVVLGGQPAAQFLMKTLPGERKPFELVATYGTCGARIVVLVVAGVEVQAAAQQMIESFRCTPDPKQEEYRAEVVVAAREGWERLEETRLLLANAKGIEVQTALFAYSEGSVADIAKRELGAIGASMTPRAGTRGDKVYWTGVDDKGLPIAILGWRCRSQRVAVVLVQAPHGVPLDEGIALADTGRCLETDEKMPDYPIRQR